MTWTYLATDLSTDLAKVRREISDTLEDDQLLSDEEINSALTDEGSVILASARCCEWIARVFSRDFDYGADGTDVRKIKRAEQYRELAGELRERASMLGSGTGGIGVARTYNQDGYQDYARTAVDHADLVNPNAED